MIKKIDIHAHVVPEAALPNVAMSVKAERLIELYDALSIERGVLLPIVSPEGMAFTMPNEHVKAIVDKYPTRFSWFCNVDARSMNNSESADLSFLINFYKELGAKGVGELTTNMYFDDPKMDNLLSHCEECKMPVLFHISPKLGVNYGAADDLHLPRLEKMLKKHKNLQFIGHSQPFWSEIGDNVNEENRNEYVTGKITEGRLPKLLREYENLYCDLSAGSGANAMMRDEEYAAGFLNEFADRIYYGCDICNPDRPFPFKFAAFLEKLREEGALAEDAYRKICRDNAAKLLGID